MMADVACSNCREYVSSELNFCIHCGQKLKAQKQKKEPLDPSIITEKISYSAKSSSTELSARARSLIQTKDLSKIVVPLLSLIGLLIISLTLVNLLDLSSVSIPLNLISIVGWSSFGLLTGITMLMSKIGKFTNFTHFLLLILAEIILLVTQYIVDIVSRSTQSRHLLLIAGLMIAIVSTLSTFKFKKSQFSQVHRISGSYLFWIIILSTSSSNYVSPWLYTSVVSLGILILHWSNLYFLNFTVLISNMIFEFLILLQTTVINSVYIFIISLVLIISTPLFFKIFEDKIVILTINVWKFVTAIYFIPLISMVISIVGGALKSPYPQILMSLLLISWIIYLAYIHNNDQYSLEIFSQISTSVTILLLLGTFLYSFRSTGIDLIVLLLAISIIISIMSFYQQQKIRYLLQFSTGFVILLSLYQVLFPLDPPLVLSTFVLVIFVFGTILVPRYKNDLSSLDILIVQIVSSGFTFLIYLTGKYSILVLIANLIFQSVIYVWHIKNKTKLRYPIFAFVIFFPLMSFAQYFEGERIFVIISIIIGFLLPIMLILDPALRNKDTTILAWLIALLPPILGWQEIQNQVLINIFLGIFIGYGYISLLIREKTYLQLYAPLLFGISGQTLRLVSQGESILFFNFDVWGMSNIVLVFFTLFLFPIVAKRKDVKLYHKIIYLIILSVFASITMTNLNYANLIVLNRFMFFQITLILLFSLMFLELTKSNKLQLEILGIGSMLIVVLITLFGPIPKFNWIPIFLFLTFFTLKSISRLNYVEVKTVNLLWLSVFSIGVFTIIFTNQWVGFLVYLLFMVTIYKGKYIKSIARLYPSLDRFLNNASYTGLMIGLTLITLTQVIGILAGLLLWIILSILNISNTKRDDTSLYFVILFNSLIPLLWLTQTEFHILILTTSILTSLLIAVNQSKMILLQSEKSYLPHLKYETISLSTSFLALTIAFGWIIIENTGYSITLVNQILVLITAGILISVLLVERIKSQNMLSNSLILYSFIALLVSSFFGYFETTISNIILVSLSMSISILSVLLKDRNMFIIGIGVSLISLLKGIFDLFILSPLDRSISMFLVGVQLIWYAIVFSNLYERDLSANISKSREN